MKGRFWLGIVISALFLFLAVHKVDIRELGMTLRSAQYLYVIPAILLTLVNFWIRTLRWKYLLEPIKNIRLHSLFSAMMIGFMANNLLPARLGEFIRAYTIGEKEGISKSSSFATIVVERVFDGLTLFLFLVIPLFFHPAPGWIEKIAYVAFVFYMGVLAFLIFLRYRTDSTLRWTGLVLRPLPQRWITKVQEILHAFAEGLQVLHDGSNLLLAALLSLGMWLCMVVTVYILLLSCELSVPLYAGFLMLGIIALGFSVPSSPGAFGPVQFFSVAGLALFAVPESQALGFSIIYHTSQYVPVTLIGLIYLWSEHLSLRTIREVK